jgi:Fe-coproporphyrin III synthase
MKIPPLFHTIQRYRTLKTDVIRALPIVILMPHSACNCQCVMCDIWKDNKNLKQLSKEDISGLLSALKKFGTKQVVMSGGEAMLNQKFFTFCQMIREHGIQVCVLSTGLTLKRNAEQLVKWTNEVIVSLDGDSECHNRIRNIPNAFEKLKEGVQYIKQLKPLFKVTARTVIHRMNFTQWPSIIDAAREIGVSQISFLPADVSSHAFNREILWTDARQHEILLRKDELIDLKNILDQLVIKYKPEFDQRFIAETPEKLRKIYDYYAAFYQLNEFPCKKCNAPWVSTVIEADGTVRPCFFHEPLGNIRENSLDRILNADKSIRFRKNLDMDADATCKKCVCYLNLPPRARVVN